MDLHRGGGRTTWLRCDYCDTLANDTTEGAKCPECPQGLLWAATSLLGVAA